MRRSAWKVSDLVLLVLSAGMAFGAFRYFWQAPPHPNAGLFLASYLATLAIASLGAFLGRPVVRRPCLGYAAFGWVNLICVMRGGLVMSTFYDAEAVVEGSKMGMAFGIVSAVVAAWLLEPLREATEDPTKSGGIDR